MFFADTFILKTLQGFMVSYTWNHWGERPVIIPGSNASQHTPTQSSATSTKYEGHSIKVSFLKKQKNFL